MSESKLQSVYENSMKPLIQRHPVSTVYVENANNICSLEDVSYNNDVSMSFPSPNFGGVSTFRFSRNYQFLGPIVVSLGLLGSADGQVYEDYVAYTIIKEIKWTVGGTELLTIKGEHMVALLNEECETQQKKNDLLRVSGYGGIIGAREIKVKALLPLPWSGVKMRDFYNSKKPFPLHMLSEPLELQITFNQLANIGANLTIVNPRINFMYGKVANVDQLKKSVYKYPFILPFCHSYEIAAADVCTVDLLGFRKGEIKQLLFHAISTAANGDLQFRRVLSGLKLNNLKLLFNGQVIWSAENDMDEIYEIIYDQNGCKQLGFREFVITATTAGTGSTNNTEIRRTDNSLNPTSYVNSAPLTATNQLSIYGCTQPLAFANNVLSAESNLFRKKYYYSVPIAELISKAQANHVIGADFSKQTLQLQFSNPKLPATTNNTSVRLYATYLYHALYQFDGNSAMFVT